MLVFTNDQFCKICKVREVIQPVTNLLFVQAAFLSNSCLPANIFCAESVVCFIYLLQILKSIQTRESCDCCVALPHYARGLSAVCDCGVS